MVNGSASPAEVRRRRCSGATTGFVRTAWLNRYGGSRRLRDGLSFFDWGCAAPSSENILGEAATLLGKNLGCIRLRVSRKLFRNMLPWCRNTALLVTLGVLLVALFPLGAGPFTATHGPLTAMRALAFVILLFVVISFLVRALALVADRDLYIRLRIQVGGVAVFDSAPVPSLRC
jgi:hypothetical protein